MDFASILNYTKMGTIVHRTLPSLHRGLLEISLTVPFNLVNI